jgi:glycosyltransferase involved in cell wall biosynthesis
MINRSSRSGRCRVFLAPLDICGIFSSYTAGLRAIGHDAEFLDLSNPSYSTWNHRESAAFIRIAEWAYFKAHKHLDTSFWKYRFYAYQYMFLSHALVVWIALRFDAVVFKSGHTITGRDLEIWLYKKCGVRIVATYHGSDSRPPYLAPNVAGLSVDELYERTVKTKTELDHVRSFADVIVDNPLSAHNQTGPCCIYQVLGNPIGPHKLDLIEKAKSQALSRGRRENRDSEKLCLVHAPSSVELKGSDRIRDALRDLERDGYTFDYVEITGRPLAEVMDVLGNADLVIDELFSDMHGAVFAQEACCFGCPIIVGGYGIEDLNSVVPEEARLPTYFTHPDRIKDAIRALLDNPAVRSKLANDAEIFTKTYGDYRAVAARLIKLIDGSAPPSWYFDPYEIRYVSGVAGSRESVRRSIELVVSKFGPAGLLMDDKPAQREALLEFVEYRRPQSSGGRC